MNSPNPPPKNTAATSARLIGSVERITYRDEESGFVIAKLKTDSATLATVVGILPDLVIGQTIDCEGQWRNHPLHGPEFAVSRCASSLPSELEAMRKYLGSGVLKGIGPKYASRILDHFGQRTFAVLDQEPQRLLEIPNFGAKRLERIAASWESQRRVREVMVFFQRFGISPALAKKIYRVWGARAEEKLRENPFALAREIYGIGFKTADEIAASFGLSRQDPKRLIAGLEYALAELTDEGHTCYPLPLFLEKAAKLLEIDPQNLQDPLQGLIDQQRAVISPLAHQGDCRPFIWPGSLYTCERGIAREIARLLQHPGNLRRFDREKAIRWAQDKLQLQLAERQKSAVSGAFDHKVQIVTGGPGTGKSTITRIIVRLALELGAKVQLAAPTGRAAKRLAQVNSCKASTLHQLLEYDFSKNAFKRQRQNPLEVDLMIVDEVSMIDTRLFYSLLKALPASCALLLIGDIDQLPSVGPGNVLRDLIESRSLPVTKLDEIFRQAQNSKIIQAAHLINRGLAPTGLPQKGDDFFLLPHEDPAKIIETIVGLVCKRLPARLSLDPFRDIQVLSAMKRGIIGLSHLNGVLQRQLHPLGEPTLINGRRFFVGDKVMQLRNNYRKEIYNGDIGRIVQLHAGAAKLVVQLLDERLVEYEFGEIDELQHAYAVSVHKYQGSESPCIIMPIHMSHAVLLQRNLLYTAVTRGKRLVILVGSQRALEFAARNRESKNRFTGLRGEILSAKINRFCPL